MELNRFTKLNRILFKGLKQTSLNQVRKHNGKLGRVIATGMNKGQIFEENKKGWITAMGMKKV